MKPSYTQLLASFVLCCGMIAPLKAQNPMDELRFNRAALRYYSGVELDAIAAQQPADYQAMLYYFTTSFTVQDAQCTQCPVDMVTFFNYDLFNIAEFESSRDQLNEVTIHFRDRYIVTLQPFETVQNHLNGRTTTQLTHLVPSRPLPLWPDSGNMENDYVYYKNELYQWAADFPEEYRTITSTGSVKKISITELAAMGTDKKLQLLQPNTYIIID